MFAENVKSSPAVVLIVEQSIVPGDVVTLKMFVFVVPVPAAGHGVAVTVSHGSGFQLEVQLEVQEESFGH